VATTVVNTNKLKALMALAEVDQRDVADAMHCSTAMICKAINNPSKYPIKSAQIHLLLSEWAKEESGLAIVKAA
jgi:uncharacterized protein YlxP (DUF503 family)